MIQTDPGVADIWTYLLTASSRCWLTTASTAEAWCASSLYGSVFPNLLRNTGLEHTEWPVVRRRIGLGGSLAVVEATGVDRCLGLTVLVTLTFAGSLICSFMISPEPGPLREDTVNLGCKLEG